MTERWLVRVLKFLVYLIIIATPLFYLRQSVYPYIFSKTLFFQGLAEILFALWLALVLADRRFLPRRTPFLAALAVFIGVLVATSLLGVDVSRSFWSLQERSLGVFAFFHLAAFALILSSLFRAGALRAKNVFLASLGTAAAVSAIAFLQIKNHNLLLNENLGGRPGATFGNPTFLAGYLSVHIFLALYLLARFFSRNGEAPRRAAYAEPIFLAASAALTLGALFLGQTRGDILGVAAGLFALVVFFTFRPPAFRLGVLNRRNFYAGLAAVLIVAGTAFWFTRGNDIWKNVPGLSRFRDISLSTPNLQPRLIALKAAWQGFLERPLSGWGWENFNVVYNKYYDPRALEVSYQETRFDKPHNVVLENLVTGGIPLLVSAVGLLGIIVFEALRSKDRLFGQFVAAIALAYFIRNLFVFETLGPLIALYLVGAAADGEYRRGEKSGEPPRPLWPWARAGRGAAAAAAVLFLSGLAPAYFINYKSVQASYFQYLGFTNFIKSKADEAITSFKKAILTPSPYTWNLRRDYATALAEAFFYNPGLIPPEEAEAAVRAMEEAAREHSADAYNHYVLVDLYNQISEVNPEKYLAAAEREAKIALRLSPDRQEVLFSLAKTKYLKGDRAAAFALLDKALALDDRVPDAHFYYGLLAFDAGNNLLGYREIKKALALGRQWKNYNEPRVVANYFGDFGRLDEAIDLYKVAIGMRPADLEAQAKLAVAYYLHGDRDLAREQFVKVMKLTDLSKGPGFGLLAPILKNLGLAK